MAVARALALPARPVALRTLVAWAPHHTAEPGLGVLGAIVVLTPLTELQADGTIATKYEPRSYKEVDVRQSRVGRHHRAVEKVRSRAADDVAIGCQGVR
jgi:hypothetical protein